MTTIHAPGDGLSRHMVRMARGLAKMHGPARELLANEGDAGATLFHIDGYTIVDAETGRSRNVMRLTGNGHGMAADELRNYMTTMFASGPDRPDNHGMGARVATLPFNLAGVVWASRHDGNDALIEMSTDTNGTFQSVDWDVEGLGLVDVVDADTAYPGVLSILDEWGSDSGTAVLLLGHDLHHHTMTQELYREFCTYAAKRWWTFPGGITKITSRAPWSGNYGNTTWSQSEILRTIAAEQGTLDLGNGVSAEWFILPRGTAETAEGGGNGSASTNVNIRRMQSSAPWSIAPMGRSIETANEVFDFRGHRSGGSKALMDFGIWHTDVANRVHITVHVPASSVVINEERSALVTPGGGYLPIAEWGRTFARQMPESIAALLEATRTGSQDEGLSEQMLRDLDPEWRRFIEDVEVLRQSRTGTHQGTPRVVPGEGRGRGSRGNDAGGSTPDPTRPHRPRVRRLEPGGAVTGTPVTQADIPVVEFLDEDPTVDGVTRPGAEIYAWFGGASRVYVRRAHPAIEQAKAKFRRGVGDTLHHVVDESVEHGYAIELAAKIVHMRVLARKGVVAGWTTSAIEDHLAAPLTMSAMLAGLNSIDAVIQRDLTRRSTALRAMDVA